MISFIGALSEVGTRDIKGSTYLDLSIDIGSIKRVSTQPKQDAATDKERPQQPQIVKTEVETKRISYLRLIKRHHLRIYAKKTQTRQIKYMELRMSPLFWLLSVYN